MFEPSFSRCKIQDQSCTFFQGCTYPIMMSSKNPALIVVSLLHSSCVDRSSGFRDANARVLPGSQSTISAGLSGTDDLHSGTSSMSKSRNPSSPIQLVRKYIFQCARAIKLFAVFTFEAFCVYYLRYILMFVPLFCRVFRERVQ